MLSEEKNAEMMSLYFNWLREIVGWRIQDMDSSYNDFLAKIPFPVEKSKELSTFKVLVNENEFNEAEQLVFLLSLAPFYIQSDLNSAATSSDDYFGKLLFNKSHINQLNYPTIDTALILLAGDNIFYKQQFYYLFGRESKLYEEDILEFSESPHNEPFTRSNLVPGKSTLSSILTGKVKGPEFSHDFPAMLIESDFEWSDLILDYTTFSQLEEVKEWLDYENICKQKNMYFKKFKKGYKCLFHGPSGTGKTLAATLIGKLTGHKVYRIDLSSVVSKYIGETEKNLSRIFDRASHGNWILFFDEADALFGKRGATQNAHDRYANQEVSYLLQRFESYEGVTILASNFKENIDTAFFRRFNSIVSFKKPEVDERYKLWEVHLPEEFKFAEDINLHEISRSVKINGSGIYNVMRRACMKAVLQGDMIISGKDMYDSVKLEFAKENKTLVL